MCPFSLLCMTSRLLCVCVCVCVENSTECLQMMSINWYSSPYPIIWSEWNFTRTSAKRTQKIIRKKSKMIIDKLRNGRKTFIYTHRRCGSGHVFLSMACCLIILICVECSRLLYVWIPNGLRIYNVWSLDGIEFSAVVVLLLLSKSS